MSEQDAAVMAAAINECKCEEYHSPPILTKKLFVRLMDWRIALMLGGDKAGEVAWLRVAAYLEYMGKGCYVEPYLRDMTEELELP